MAISNHPIGDSRVLARGCGHSRIVPGHTPAPPVLIGYNHEVCTGKLPGKDQLPGCKELCVRTGSYI